MGAAAAECDRPCTRRVILVGGARDSAGTTSMLTSTATGRQLLRTTRSGSPGFQIVTSIAPSTISTDDAPVRSAT
jgi:hypothetical protein